MQATARNLPVARVVLVARASEVRSQKNKKLIIPDKKRTKYLLKLNKKKSERHPKLQNFKTKK